MNLVFLTLDAWRADYVDAYAGVPLLPCLDGVRNARLERCYATGPWTSPALVSVFIGESSWRHGVHHAWDRPKPRWAPLVTLLKAAGYHAPNLCYLNRVQNYLDLGYDPAQTPDPPHYTADPLADPTLFDALRDTPEPFFIWYHYKFTHLPYWASQASREALGVEPSKALVDAVGTEFVCPHERFQLDPTDTDQIRRMYAAGVRDADAWVERVLETLESSGRASRTSLVLSADHGEELMERGHVGHASTSERATLFEEALRIPFVLVDPRLDANHRCSTRAIGSDLYATLLGLVGLRGEGSAVDFSDALLTGSTPAVDPHRVFAFASSRRGYVAPRDESGDWVVGASDGQTKVIERWVRGRTSRTRYDLVNDPGEFKPL